MGNSEQESQAAHDPFALTGLTYDDVLLLPGDTDVIPSEASTTTRLTKEIEKVGYNPCTFLVSPTTGGRSDYSPLCTV